MRLSIVNLTGGGLSGGYRKYLQNMLPRLAEHSEVSALLCVSPEGSDVTAWFKKPPSADYCSCSTLTLCHLAHIPDRKMAGCIRRFSPDIVFLPVERYIRFDGLPVVNMVQNMEPFVPNMKGDPLQERVKKFIQRKIGDNSLKRADHTIAVSGFVKDYLTATLHLPENKVSQIYHGINPLPNGSCTRPASVPIGWDGGFLFTCGSIRPARGLEDALEALSALRGRNLDMKLVIAGATVPGMRKYRDGLERWLASRGLTDRVCWAEYLNDEEMRWCYNRCSLFIMTSRVESFGMIGLEAMANGCLCVVADNPCLPEIFGDCAAFYEAGNGRSLAETIQNRLALEPGGQKAISERSCKRSSMFSWDLTADKTVSVLMQTLQCSKGREGRAS